jgi:chromosome partitioning protein
MSNTPVFSIANQKGGVGKTTTAISLSAALAERKKRVLLLDLDSQANATSGLGLPKTEGQSILSTLLEDADVSSLVQQTSVPGLDIVASELDLAGAERELANLPAYLQRLRTVLSPLAESGRYDFAFVDCPPSLNILTLNAFCASDGVIIPMQCEYFALEGISVILRMIDKLREAGAAPKLAVEGIVMTMYDVRTNLSRQVTDEIRSHFPEAMYATLIPRSVRLAEAPSHGQSVLAYAPESTGAAAYRKLAREFLKRRAAKEAAHA